MQKLTILFDLHKDLKNLQDGWPHIVLESQQVADANNNEHHKMKTNKTIFR